MIVLLDNFLAKEEWRKYQLLKKVERSPYFALTKKELSDDLEMSNYVLKSTIDQLVLDLERFGLAKEIHLFVEEPFVQVESTGTANSDTLLENYVKESISFNILLGASLEKFKSLNEFSEKETISYPIAHSTYKKLNHYLKDFELQIDKKFRLTGKSEKNIRLFLTELFARIYRGQEDIFTSSDRSLIHAKLQMFDSAHFTVHEKNNLMYYLYVTNLRIQQKKYISEKRTDNLLIENFSQELSDTFFRRVPDTFREAEVYAFFCYYATCSESLDQELSPADDSLVTTWSQDLLVSLSKVFPKIANNPENQKAFMARSRFLHFQLLETSLAYEAIQPEINIIYFQQNYPALLEFCGTYVKEMQQTNPELYRKKKQVLFQYLFLILDAFPKNVLLETIKVYVDFSFGHLYNQFIMENIGFFHQVGAEITTTITEADILLTDSRDLGSLYKKECIVWLAPPRPLDWANLGQKIIQKRADTERETQD